MIDNKFQKIIRNLHTDEIFINSNNNNGIRIPQCTIEEILPYLLISSTNAIIEKNDKISIAASMLTRFYKSFTNNIVVLENEYPVGVVGKTELLEGLYDNPTFDFFNNTTVNEIMNKDLITIITSTKLSSLLKMMEKSKRDFAIIKNKIGSFSTISSRRLLEIGVLSNSVLKVSDLPMKKIHAFKQSDTVKDVIFSMLQNQVDVLMLENTPLFITANTIFETIQNDLCYLHGINDFMDFRINNFKLNNAKIISNNTTIHEMCTFMLNMKQPYLITSNQLLTPFDMITALCRS
ncbi:MAG: hypothetical protein HY222_02060 [Thaumarchaeota archaeon]|nr:hypothetical protein [Nitrososphaerota archaeon]MBI3641157.1 hypothetical protein [Nitrososphaerota archaeon]